MKTFMLLTILLSANVVFAYPDECTKFENKLIDYTAKFNSGVEPDGDIKKINPEMNAILDKHSECRPQILMLAQKMTKSITTFIEIDKAKNAKVAKKENKSNLVDYDEWFTLQKTGIKSGKKYTFVACVNGSRDATAVRCNVPGSAAKRVFYSTDDIKDIETKKIWVNTINEDKCVTAYVTGGQAFIYNIQEASACK